MNVLTLPKAAATLEYKALRLPATLIESQVVVRFLAEDSALRLGFERALGTLDEKAGSVLGNDDLTQRGHALRRRSEVLGKAVALEATAQARKESAEATIVAGAQSAQQTREAARQSQRAQVQDTLRTEKAEKKRVEQQAAARLTAERKRVQDEARAQAQAVASQRDAHKQQIQQATKARTAGPKAQLTEAVADKRGAQAQRHQADRLAALAADERASRKAARP